MSHSDDMLGDTAPGDESLDEHEQTEGIAGYVVGLGLATLLTIVAFFIAHTTLVWQPSIPVALSVLAGALALMVQPSVAADRGFIERAEQLLGLGAVQAFE